MSSVRLSAINCTFLPAHFFMELKASICARAIRSCSGESDLMRSMSSFSSRTRALDFREPAEVSKKLLRGLSSASAIAINVSKEGSAWARSKLLRLADVRLMRSASPS